MHRFARGPGPGSFLHGLLEWAGREGFAATPMRWKSHCPALQSPRLGRLDHCTLNDWLRHCCNTDACRRRSAPVVLGQLSQYQVEMEFWFAGHKVDILELDALVCQHTHNGVRAGWPPNRCCSMACSRATSTWRSSTRAATTSPTTSPTGWAEDAAYTEQAMAQSMLDNRYELQYVLYLFALHRLLKARLADYDYERHMGGAVYLFLRGTRRRARACISSGRRAP